MRHGDALSFSAIAALQRHRGNAATPSNAAKANQFNRNDASVPCRIAKNFTRADCAWPIRQFDPGFKRPRAARRRRMAQRRRVRAPLRFAEAFLHKAYVYRRAR